MSSLQMIAGGFFTGEPIQEGQPQKLNWDDRTGTGYLILPEFNHLGLAAGYTVERHQNGVRVDRQYAYDSSHVMRITRSPA